MRPGPQRSVCIIYGQTGSGKSVLARAVAQAMARVNSCPLIVVDTLEEYVDLPAIELGSVCEWLKQVRQATDSSCRVLCPDEEALDQLLSRGGGVFKAYSESPGPVVVLIDETSYWTKPNYVSPGLRDAVRYGRHSAINLVCVARSPAETARELTRQATELRIFRVIEKIDLENYGRILPADIIDILPSLEPHVSITYTFTGTYTIQPPVKIVAQ